MAVRIDSAGCVTFRLLSLSRGSGAVGVVLFPLLGRMQRAFFAEQVDVMQRLASSLPSATRPLCVAGHGSSRCHATD